MKGQQSFFGLAIAASLLCGCAWHGKRGPLQSCHPKGITPERYHCFRASEQMIIDGRIEESEWRLAPWAGPFVDIRGDGYPQPEFQTRAKLLYDDDFLYIAAELQDPHVCGFLTSRDDIVFHDKDFEIFIDPDSDTENYYEIEVNALNTIFDLLLVRTYIDGGPAVHDWDLSDMRHAVYVNGTINDPSDTDIGWSVEFALPWKRLMEYAKTAVPPKQGDVWRVNFSRVHWQYEIEEGVYVKKSDQEESNWVWSPQGKVNMHLPRLWGYVEFHGSPERSR